MPDIVIEIPRVGNVAFPDTMTEAAIQEAAAKLYREAQSAAPAMLASHAPTSQADVIDLSGGTQDFENITNDRIAEPALATVATTLAVPGGVGLLGRTAIPYAAPAARGAAAVLANPFVGGVAGGVAGYQAGGVPGALGGMVLGSGRVPLPRMVRSLKQFANKIDPPPPVVTPNAAASRRMIAGMSSPPQATAPTTVAAPASPVAAPPAVAAPAPPVAAPPVPVAAPGAAQSAAAPPPASILRPAMSPQRIQNELGIQARRQQVTLSEPEYKQAAELVRAGKTPTEAVATMKAQQPPPAAAPTAGPDKLRLTAAETQAYAKLRIAGKSHEEAVGAIEEQRRLAQTFGLPTGEDVRKAVAERNATGRWGATRKP